MSLSTREQHVLHSIEGRLTVADPPLAARLAMFTRLASGEDMPGHERIQADHQWRTARQPRRRNGPGRDTARRGALWLGHSMRMPRAMLLLWLVMAVALTTVALAVNRSVSKNVCIPPWTLVCTSQALPHRSGIHARGDARTGPAQH